jgi:hypothetical protein
MGCWNATCNISNLPIFAGEKVVVIPLVRVMDNACATNCCYPTDNFVPYAFPIIGEYNDYGGVENAVTFEENKKHLMALEFFYSNRRYDDDENENPYKPFDKKESFDDFVSDIICCHEGCYIKEDVKSELHPDGMSETSFMMIHYDLYMKLIEEIGNRRPYGKEEPFNQLLLKGYKKTMAKHHENIERFGRVEDEAADKEKILKMTECLRGFEVSGVLSNIFGRGVFLNTNKWRYFCYRMLDDISVEDEILDAVVNQALLIQALSALRKGFHCDSGCGSQSQETRMHIVLANYMIEHVKKLAEQDREDSIDSEMPDDGVEETIFYSE